MKLRSVVLVLGLSFFVALGGCRTAPVYNVEKSPIVSNKQNLTVADVAKAIERAGTGLGWQINNDRPGHMLGTLNLREHKAVVDIDYDTKTYTIRYKDSSNLNHSGDSIHSNYNGWVQRLDSAIKSQLSLL
mgnify:CR=1 FL=1